MLGLAEKLNEPGEQLYRTALRDACLRLLNSLDMPGKEAVAGREWAQGPGRTARDLERLKARTLARLEEVRSQHLNQAA